MRALLVLTVTMMAVGCAGIRSRGTWAGRSNADTAIVGAAIAIAIAIEGDESDELWCDDDVADPPHTCPAKTGGTRK